jgi:uncharacterized protein Smg (DUF494 family)
MSIQYGHQTGAEEFRFRLHAFMKTSITQLVDKIVQKLQENTTAVPSVAGIRNWLCKQGYCASDVDEALQELKPQLDSMSSLSVPQHTRVLSPYESFLLTSEAKSALMRLELYGLIGMAEREILLERLEQYEGEIDLGGLEYVLSTHICAGYDVAHQQIMFQVLDGSEGYFH